MTQLIGFFLLLSVTASAAANAPFCALPTAQEIDTLLRPIRSQTVPERAQEISAQLLDRPYQLAPCGEGEGACFDQKPLTTFEKFDCTTYTEAVLALAKTKTDSNIHIQRQNFLRELREIKYKDAADIQYENRNHFVEADWLPNAQKKKVLKDISQEVYPESPAREKTISKAKWYAAKTESDLACPEASPGELAKKLELLRAAGEKIDDKNISLHYVPLEKLLDPEVQAKIPDFTQFNLVKDEPLKGAPTMVSHQGFLVRKQDGKLYLRHATPAKAHRKVVDMPFDDYVKERMKDTTWPTLGFNLQAVEP